MLKVGIVGLGRGMGYYNTFLHYPETEVVAVCDKDEKLVQEFNERDNVEKVYTVFRNEW